MRRYSWLMAGVVGLACAAGLCAADSGRWIVIVSDANRDLMELAISDTVPTGRWILYPAAWQSPGADSPKGAGSALRLTISREDPGANLILKATFGTQPDKASALPDGPQTDLGTYLLAPEVRTPVETGQPYSIPRLWFRLTKAPEDCGLTAAEVRVLTPSVQIQKVERQHGACVIIMRNVSAKGIMAVATQSPYPGGNHGSMASAFPSEWPGTRPLIRPNGTYTLQAGLSLHPGQRLDAARDGYPAITLVVFEDGTYEGDADQAMQVLGQKAGYAFEARRFAAVVRKLLAQENEANLTSELRQALDSLPDTHSEDPNPFFAAGWKQGLRDEKMSLTRAIEEGKSRGPLAFRQYWAFRLKGLDLVAGQ